MANLFEAKQKVTSLFIQGKNVEQYVKKHEDEFQGLDVYAVLEELEENIK